MTTANKITMVRVAMIPVFLVLCLWPFPHHYLASVIIFAIASITDYIDGYIARKYNQVTTFGKFVDPLADKLLVISALLVFTQAGFMHSVCTFIIIARELIITSLRILAMGEGVVMAAGFSGKVKTFSQMLLIIASLLVADFFPANGTLIVNIFSYVMAAITLWSGIDYLWRHRSLIMKTK